MNSSDRSGFLTPSLAGAARVEAAPGQRPWRPQSMFYVAFFGGLLPLTWIAYQNAERLGMPADARRRIAIVGGLVTLAVMVAMGAFIADPSRLSIVSSAFPDMRPTQVVRLLTRASAVGLYLLFLSWLKSANRRYAAFGAGEYDSLWRPGLVAVIVGDLIMVAVGGAIAGAFLAAS